MGAAGGRLRRAAVLVTGGRGLLGAQVCRQLDGAAGRVQLLQQDVRELETLTQRFDIVCHLAGITKVDAGHDARALCDVNVTGTLAVLEYCRSSGARCVLASSAAVYRPAAGGARLAEASPLGPGPVYGISKMVAEDCCRYYAKRHGVPTTVLRIFNLYGPGQDPDFLVPYVIQQLVRLEPVVLRTPNAVRDFVYVADVADAIVHACAYEPSPFAVFNVGSGSGLAVRELVERAAAQLGVEPQVATQGPVPAGDAVVADCRAVEAALGWTAQTGIEEGLARMLQHSALPVRG